MEVFSLSTFKRDGAQIRRDFHSSVIHQFGVYKEVEHREVMITPHKSTGWVKTRNLLSVR